MKINTLAVFALTTFLFGCSHSKPDASDVKESLMSEFSPIPSSVLYVKNVKILNGVKRNDDTHDIYANITVAVDMPTSFKEYNKKIEDIHKLRNEAIDEINKANSTITNKYDAAIDKINSIQLDGTQGATYAAIINNREVLMTGGYDSNAVICEVSYDQLPKNICDELTPLYKKILNYKYSEEQEINLACDSIAKKYGFTSAESVTSGGIPKNINLPKNDPLLDSKMSGFPSATGTIGFKLATDALYTCNQDNECIRKATKDYSKTYSIRTNMIKTDNGWRFNE